MSKELGNLKKIYVQYISIFFRNIYIVLDLVILGSNRIEIVLDVWSDYFQIRFIRGTDNCMFVFLLWKNRTRLNTDICMFSGKSELEN